MPEISPTKYLVTAGWDDVPHLTDKMKESMLRSAEPHLRDARSRGDPSLGSGSIYPIAFSEVSCKPLRDGIPAYWKKAYALDVGWKRTAAVWGAHNPDEDCIYIYTEHYRGQAIPLIHATAIKTRGAWIKGCVDPSARGRSQKDGETLMAAYRGAGLKLIPAINTVEAGIYEVWTRLITGRLKFYSTCQNLAVEYAMYRRDENGKIIKDLDHAMDAVRYLVMTWDKIASLMPPANALGNQNIHGPADNVAGM